MFGSSSKRSKDPKAPPADRDPNHYEKLKISLSAKEFATPCILLSIVPLVIAFMEVNQLDADPSFLCFVTQLIWVGELIFWLLVKIFPSKGRGLTIGAIGILGTLAGAGVSCLQIALELSLIPNPAWDTCFAAPYPMYVAALTCEAPTAFIPGLGISLADINLGYSLIMAFLIVKFVFVKK